MPGERSIMDAILTQQSSEETSLVNILFPTEYEKKKGLSEITPELIFPETLLGTIQRRFGSKVLKMFDDELLTRMKSKDRKGILEIVEVLLATRRAESSSLE